MTFSKFEQGSSWISYQQDAPREGGRRATFVFAQDFDLASQPVRATLQATAFGMYQGFLNGANVTDDLLLPGFTEYQHRLQVHTFDVSSQIRAGRNQLWFELADGWYRGQVGIVRNVDQWGDRTAVRALLTVELSDGSSVVLGTDDTWRHRQTSHLADIIEGEVADFNVDVPGSLEPVLGTAAWQPAQLTAHNGAAFVEPIAPPVRRTQELAPVSITQSSGVQEPQGYTVDFGQNIAGWVGLGNLGPAGGRLRLVYGEALDAQGQVTQANFKPNVPFLPFEVSAGQVDHVVSSGVAGQVFEPVFSTKGFRYVRVEGLDAPLALADITAVVVHSHLTPVGTFECSSSDLNWLHQATRWSMRGNIVDIPTDCPTRERAGWGADWDIFFNTASFLFDVDTFTQKWLADLESTQWDNGIISNQAPMPKAEGQGSPIGFMNGSAGWGDSIISIPYKHFGAYGNLQVLETAWPHMVRWMDFVTNAAATGRHQSRIDANPTPAPHERYLWDTGFHFGEWLEPIEPGAHVDLGAIIAADHGIVATAYFAHSTALLTRIANLLGNAAQAMQYAELSLKVRAAWNKEFVKQDGTLMVPTQANCVRALAFNLIAPQHRAAVTRQLVDLIQTQTPTHPANHLGTGFLATPSLLPTLADAGHAQLAYQVLTQRTWPSWLAMKDQGATTVWERWEGYDQDGNPTESHNHYSKGAVSSFLYQYLAGIRPVEAVPLSQKVLIQPLPLGDITWAKATHQTDPTDPNNPNGQISVHWTRTGNAFNLELQIPDGCSADVVLPDSTRTLLTGGTHHLGCQLGNEVA